MPGNGRFVVHEIFDLKNGEHRKYSYLPDATCLSKLADGAVTEEDWKNVIRELCKTVDRITNAKE